MRPQNRSFWWEISNRQEWHVWERQGSWEFFLSVGRLGQTEEETV